MQLAEYEEAVGAQKNRVYSLAYYILGKPEDAEEVLQDVLLKLWSHREKVDLERIGPWLSKVTRNACFDQLRRRTSAGRDRIHGVESEQLERAPTDSRNPEELATSADLTKRIQTELHRMKEPFRSVLILRELQELKYTEISEALDLPLNTVRVYLHRGRKRLRERLRPITES